MQILRYNKLYNKLWIFHISWDINNSLFQIRNILPLTLNTRRLSQISLSCSWTIFFVFLPKPSISGSTSIQYVAIYLMLMILLSYKLIFNIKILEGCISNEYVSKLDQSTCMTSMTFLRWFWLILYDFPWFGKYIDIVNAFWCFINEMHLLGQIVLRLLH